jgi:hypothetical protein
MGRVVVHPTNSNVVYIAALGNIYGPSPDRGVYRSTDGGRSWKKILARARDPENVGPVELAIRFQEIRVLYARSGPRGGRRGPSMRPPTCPGAACTSPPMAVKPGSQNSTQSRRPLRTHP